MFKYFALKGPGDASPQHLLEFDPVTLTELAVQTAACVLVICGSREPHHPNPESEFDAVGLKLSDYVTWPTMGYTSALQRQVEFLYDCVKMCLDDTSKRVFFLEREDRMIIVDALKDYQAWITRYCSGSNKKDWADLNERFLRVTQES